MRTRHWFKNLFSGLLCATAASVVSAQDAFMADPAQLFNGGGPPYVPYVDPNSPQAAAYAQPYTGMEAGGLPPGAAAWPQISPLAAPAFEQHRYENGFWLREQLRRKQTFYADIAAGLTEYGAGSNAVVGNPKAPGFYQQTTGAAGNAANAAGRLQEFFPRRTWSDTRDPLTAGGAIGQVGFFNENGTGMFVGGFWAGEAGSVFDGVRPIGDPNNRPADTLYAKGGGVPLLDQGEATTLPTPFNASTAPLFLNGGTQPYDTLYRLEWQSQAMGAGVGYYIDPIIRRRSFILRPLVGLRYLKTDENARFRGIDSGLDYTIEAPGTTTGAGGGGAGGAQAGLQLNRPTLATITGTIPVTLFESRLYASTSSQLGGPELGFRYDLGGEKFKLWGQTKLGVLANHSTREMHGFGIGRTDAATFRQDAVLDPTLLAINSIPNNPTLNSPANPTGTGFREQNDTTTVSPVFEQSFFIKSPILSYVPIVRKAKVFESAEFQVGYTLLLIGSTYRPGDVVEWRGWPDFPTLKDDKSTFHMQTLSLGVEWTR